MPIEDLCGWIGDENNCYRRFATNVGETCGTFDLSAGKPGQFYTRDKLDVCVLESGGQVVFDPPLDVTQFPVTKASFAFITDQGEVCGAAAIAPDGAMAITVSSAPPVEDGGKCEQDGGTSPDGGPLPGSEICGGTFSAKPVTARELVDTSCPGGETHHFNRLQLAKCPEYASLFPRAEIESNPGSINIPGFVRFRIFYPPTAGALENQQAQGVEYFNCVIPGGVPPCGNGVQDSTEADIDCGATCPDKCLPSQKCKINLDCVTQTCSLVNGLKQCQPNPNCMNAMTDPAEGDEDCGAVCEKPCELGKTCNTNADCVSASICTADAQGTKRCTAVMP
jgi:hypothetical protein